jgi:low temperature requirement protein LtrA
MSPQATGSASTNASEGATQVSQLELFFDLVFVFTITQLTTLLSNGLTWRNIWHAVVTLGLIFWMYDGYAWLTNAVPARGATRERLLIAGMAGYLVLAIAVPRAFQSTGLTFGIAYLVITTIHAFLYVTSAAESSSMAMRELAPWNLLGAVVVLISGALGGTVQEVCWTAVFVGYWFATHISGGFEIQPAHFVERHGLLMIIAIGEAVVATGLAARNEPVSLTLVITAVLGLLLSAGLWWSYFGSSDTDDDQSDLERAFAAATGPDRPRLAFYAFGYAFFVMLFGIVLTAVGLRHAVARPDSTLSTAAAFALSGGVVIFLLGLTAFRVILGLKALHRWSAVSVLLLVAVPFATDISALAGLAVLVGGVGLLLATNEQRQAGPGLSPLPDPVSD